MRVIAMYLPQFHQIKENDEWWGEGFTEWTAVKSAKPLYDGHEQPRIPLNDYYYDLLDRKTMEWQSDLMHQYGVDGMCIYHYWFKDGKKLLEKPAENLLKWKDIDMPFCFCWANETWARTWSKLDKDSNNAWADIYEPSSETEMNKCRDGILVEQSYGGKNDWEDHFRYLLPFFRDSRYICIDEKPLILVYKVTNISCFREMSALWRDMAVKNGLKGLYIVGGGLEKDYSDCLDGIYYRSPTDLVDLYKKYPDCVGTSKPIPYEAAWESILNSAPIYKAQPYFMGLTGYDNTPRKGKKGIVYEKASPEFFGKMLKNLMLKNYSYGSEITFINAWNEWGEGMYLEPDSMDGYSFLNAVKEARESFEQSKKGEFDEAFISEFVLLRRKYESERDLCKRAGTNASVMDRWMTLMEKGIDIFDFFPEKIKNVALYGYGLFGRRLYRMLVEKQYTVNCVVDKNQKPSQEEANSFGDCCFVNSINDMPEVDCCIISVTFGHEAIEDEIKNKEKACRVVTITGLIKEAENKMDNCIDKADSDI